MQNIDRAEQGICVHDVGDDGVVTGADLADGVGPEGGRGEHQADDGDSVEARHSGVVRNSVVSENVCTVLYNLTGGHAPCYVDRLGSQFIYTSNT